MKKENALKIKLSYPDARTKDYVQAALSITNHIRLSKKLDIMSESTFLMNAVLDGSGQIHKFYRQVLEQQEKEGTNGTTEAKVVEESKAVAEDGVSSEASDSTG